MSSRDRAGASDKCREKKIHLVIVSRPLAVLYEHQIHHQGDYKVDYTFPKGGEFVLFQDYSRPPGRPEPDRGRDQCRVEIPRPSSSKR
jgi:hypothetical protein